MIDPRIRAIEERTKDVKRIIPVVSGKGGVGKSMISTTLALLLREKNYRVGLLDLDFHGASDHVILNADTSTLPEEEKGVIPSEVSGIKFMSIVFYSQDKPTPLRGMEISDALVELMAITRWGPLDFLIIDMPPGMGDQFLDLLRFLRRGEFILVGTPSPLALNVVNKVLEVLKEQNVKVLGLIENMARDKEFLKELAKKHSIRYLGKIRLIPNIDYIIGNVEQLLNSEFAQELKKIVERI
ncbi:ATPase involved in chromosome partitioning [Aciduliprofundum sp. MAR08-339]|uniref:Mrp/NBP35 family ATP-binding protein n=1 Tax=Aciduliprofundum sp. (strain MAR08-339) TaxID=673860 RepID=UPI0002A48870|nr:ATPase involved in chromosome partitioning [Aciduliprofundum sp. MAR08-339]